MDKLNFRSVVPIVVYEAEPSSIIAYALNSHDYKLALHERLRNLKTCESMPSPINRRMLQENKENVIEISRSGEI
jgi:1-phosphatidylinositol-3-phosphate 5-kinase